MEEFWLDEEEIFERNKQRVLAIIRMERGTNRIVILHEAKLTDLMKIGAYLLGVYVKAKLLGQELESTTHSEISGALGLKPPVVRARLGDLREKGLVEQTGRGEHRISLLALEQLLNEIESKLQ